MTQEKLPTGWVRASLSDVAEINPGSFSKPPLDHDLISFVPMAAVEEESGRLDPSTHRPWLEVKKGYTLFQDDDVIFAKVTPCMENGKAALAARLHGGRGAGSTEFFVLRSRGGVDPKYLMHFVLQSSFRRDARSAMQGVAGLLRVRKEFMQTVHVPVAPLPEQRRIVAEIERQFTRLDAGVEALKRVQAQFKRYRASVLKAACEGRLVPTEAELTRSEKRDYEPADRLLARILKERRAGWEAEQLAKMKAAGKSSVDDKWKARYIEPKPPDPAKLPSLPAGWTWATLGQVAPLQAGYAFSSTGFKSHGIRLVKGINVRDGWLSEEEVDYWDPKEAGDFLSYRLSRGDLVLAMDRPVYSSGSRAVKVARLGEEWNGALLLQRVGRFKTSDPTLRPYLWWFLRSEAFRQHLILSQNGSQDGKDLPHVSAGVVDGCTVPLPPLFEQARIVEAVERRISVAEQALELVEANLRRANGLRMQVLRDAFRGRLVPQDLDDEPASNLLERSSMIKLHVPAPSQNRLKRVHKKVATS